MLEALQALAKRGWGRGKCVRQHCSRSLFLCSAPLLLLLQLQLQLGGCCAAPLPAKFWRGGSAASAAALPARPPPVYAFFLFPHAPPEMPMKTSEGLGQEGASTSPRDDARSPPAGRGVEFRRE